MSAPSHASSPPAPEAAPRAMIGKARLEAFSDGVFAIIITIMVLEMKVPVGESFQALLPVAPTFLCYVLSFVYAGIYWNNHHHLLHAAHAISGGALWANLHLLFWLSLLPFTTAWMGENHFAAAPTVLYGSVLLAAAVAYAVLQWLLIRADGQRSLLRRAVGSDWKGKLSPLLYLAAIALAWRWRWLSQAIYVGVALLWLVPDRRIERALAAHAGPAE